MYTTEHYIDMGSKLISLYIIKGRMPDVSRILSNRIINCNATIDSVNEP